MATYKGNGGTIKIGSDAVANLRSYSLEASAATSETTTMGSLVATHLPTITSWTGSCDVFWDPADTNGQVALAVGNVVTIKFTPVDTSAADDVDYEGSVIVTGHSKTASHDGNVEASLSFQGTGPLTPGTS
tara:strand:+ start:194 stop:586 length:393 start_codon:yes stop_codon:yes gene_type:complete